MRKKFQQIGLLAIGAALGVAGSLHFSAVADRQASTLQLPVDDLRLFSEVFGRIKSDYVEPVEDRKLLKEAINGMLTGLDPHSAFLDQEAYRDLQVGTQGEFGGLGIEVGMEDGFVKVIAPIEDTPAYRAGLVVGGPGPIPPSGVQPLVGRIPRLLLVAHGLTLPSRRKSGRDQRRVGAGGAAVTGDT